ncbi:MAG: hypothetical protein ABL955_06860 [Elusimicrobiota bacterium]
MSGSLRFDEKDSKRPETVRGLVVLAFASALFAAPGSAYAKKRYWQSELEIPSDARGQARYDAKVAEYHRHYDHPDDIYVVLKQHTENGRVYFVDAVRDNRLIFKAVPHSNTHMETYLLSREELVQRADERRRTYDTGPVTYTGQRLVSGPDYCELRSNAAVRVVGEDLAPSMYAGGGKTRLQWKDRRGFLHSTEFLARQLRYNKWNHLAGANAPQIPETGILDSRTLRIDSEMLHHELGRAEQDARVQGARTVLRKACLELGGDAVECDSARGASPEGPESRLPIDAARAALARYDEALNAVRFVKPRPIDLPVYNENDDKRTKADFEKKLENSNFERLSENDGMALGKIECDFHAADFPPTVNEAEDGVTEQVDSLSFDLDQIRTLTQLKDETQRLINSAAPGEANR